MKQKIVYVLHEYGAHTHYLALDVLAHKKGYRLKYYEFSFYNLLKRVVKRNNYTLLQWIKDWLVMIRLGLSKGEKVVIGIAPYNADLRWMRFILKHHEVYYHTSYTCWDGSRFAHKPANDRIKALWKKWVSKEVKHIFAVSEYTKSELVRNGFSEATKISVVNHSYDVTINSITNNKKENRFISVCMLSKYKGVDELLEYFKGHPEAHLTLVGKGDMVSIVKEYALQYPNIEYKGFIKGLINIIPIYMENSFLILNSKRTKSWEELFGMAIIEGMACGCVPITTDHHGPKEIISDGKDGFICREGEIGKGIDMALAMNDDEYQLLRKEAISTGQLYSAKNIASKWIKIFE